jgi:hypothetical protein
MRDKTAVEDPGQNRINLNNALVDQAPRTALSNRVQAPARRSPD